MARAAVVVFALISCAHHQTMMYGEPAPEFCAAGPSTDDERCLGWLLDRVMLMSASDYEDRELVSYVRSVGARLVAAAGDHRTWTFHVLDDPEVQANANISTTVYITRGALAKLRGEAELAGLLGHEIGHVLAGHAREALLDELRGISTDPARQVRAARDDEIQADQLAVMLTSRAGYDPRAVETMLRALAAGQNDDDDPSDRHPRWSERLARVQAYAARFPRGELAEAPYRAHVRDLIVDDDPRQAALVGHAAIFARAHEAIDLPAWKTASAHGGSIHIELPGDVTLELWTLPKTISDAMHGKPLGLDDAFVTRHALLVAARGPGAASVIQSLRQAQRAPRPSELAALVPRHVDFSAPRPLWPGK